MSKWEPIETAPKDGTRVLLAGSYSKGTISSATGYWSDTFWSGEGGWTEDEEYSICISEPTHWMPLPELPKR